MQWHPLPFLLSLGSFPHNGQEQEHLRRARQVTASLGMYSVIYSQNYSARFLFFALHVDLFTINCYCVHVVSIQYLPFEV